MIKRSIKFRDDDKKTPMIEVEDSIILGDVENLEGKNVLALDTVDELEGSTSRDYLIATRDKKQVSSLSGGQESSRYADMRQRPKLVRSGTHRMIWMDDEPQDKGSLRGSERSARIPSWSKQDRFKRALIIPKLLLDLLGSSLFLGLVYVIVCLIPGIFRDQTKAIQRSNFIVTLVFIFLQTFVSMLSAIPKEDTTNKEASLKINASILIAMTMYPCLGLWFGTRPIEKSFSEFLINDINNFWEFKNNEIESYQWGSIFPFLFWSSSACIVIRESNFSFTLDREGVISDEEGKAMTVLFRRHPSIQERFLHQVTWYLTFSLWSILPSKYCPIGWEGRFAFQLVAPFIFIFFYVGFRFMLFAASEINHVLHNPNDYTR